MPTPQEPSHGHPSGSSADREALLKQCHEYFAQSRGLEEVIVGISHELNNPLTSIQGLAQLAAQDVQDPGLREDLELVAEESNRAVRILRTLREYVGPVYGEPMQSADPQRLLEVAVRTREYEIRARGVALEVHVDDSLPTMEVNRRLLSHLFLQMVLQAEKAVAANAARETPEAQAAIDIRAWSEDDTIHVRCTDTGSPVPEESRTQLTAQPETPPRDAAVPRDERPESLAPLVALSAALGGVLEATYPEAGGLTLEARIPVHPQE